MDLDIQFGDLEESRPETQLRPDQNRHFAISPYEEPVEDDLPVFVDVDVMKDMERHALEDTSVELGGVLLGGQYQDADGNPFVVISDSLRAQHYEATKGSFKFTHDTWEQITREREDFPPELQMVGWYHTHPDWGVFLSGMDMFICDNFFNKPLDVALVIDPCRGDRGMFMWTGDPSQRVRRCSGFHLTASRFRADELNMFAAQLEQRIPMSTGSSYSNIAGSISGAPPVVNIQQDRSPWLPLMALTMFLAQTALLGFLAWKVLTPPPAPAPQTASVEQLGDALQQRFDNFDGRQLDDIRRQAQIEVLNRVVATETGKTDVVSGLAQSQTQLAQLQRDNRAYQLAQDQLNSKLAVMKSQVALKDAQINDREEAIKARKTDYELLENNYLRLEKKLETTLLRLKEYEPGTVVNASASAKEQSWLSGWRLGVLIGGIALTLITVIVFAALKMQTGDGDQPHADTPENSSGQGPAAADSPGFSITSEDDGGNFDNDPPSAANNQDDPSR